jgi:CRP-like cAMP-binding protein
MPKHSAPPAPRTNRLLARMSDNTLQRLRPHLQRVPLEVPQVLYKPLAPIDYVYFPDRGVLSALAIMTDGSAIEVGNIGNEGVAGVLSLAGAKLSPNQVIVQVDGEGQRVRSEVLDELVGRDDALRQLFLTYHATFLHQVSQSVACNGLHPIRQRCCRWMLMTHDRVHADEMPLTHEFLGIMLGVRRASVTEVLQALKKEGLIRYTRGNITVLDRPGLEAVCCECYHLVREEYDRLFG